MICTNATADESTARSSDHRDPRIRIGTDCNDFEHHFFPHENAVVVIDTQPGRRVHRKDLGAASVSEWIIEIGKRDGWADQDLYASWANGLADMMEPLV